MIKKYLPFFLHIFFTLFFLTACGASSPETRHLENQIQTYCLSYAKASAEKFLRISQPLVEIQKLESSGGIDKAVNALVNALTPKDYRIEEAYHCYFGVTEAESQHKGSVLLVLRTNKKAAEYDADGWEAVQLTDIGLINLLNSDKLYYLVPKYLKLNGKDMHLKENNP